MKQWKTVEHADSSDSLRLMRAWRTGLLQRLQPQDDFKVDLVETGETAWELLPGVRICAA